MKGKLKMLLQARLPGGKKLKGQICAHAFSKRPNLKNEKRHREAQFSFFNVKIS